MIELKENDLVKIETKEDGGIILSVVIKANNNDNNDKYRYYTNSFFGFNDNFMDDSHSIEVIAVWRYDERTNIFVNIYDKDVIERIKNAKPIKGNPTNFYSEPCELVEPDKVEYDKYISLEHENAELRNIIMELNKKLYESNKIH